MLALPADLLSHHFCVLKATAEVIVQQHEASESPKPIKLNPQLSMGPSDLFLAASCSHAYFNRAGLQQACSLDLL